MSKSKNVSAAVVREWAASQPEGTFTAPVGQRGKPNPEHVTAFHKANKGKRYAPGVAEGRFITRKVKTPDKNGRLALRPVTLSTREAREILGQVDEDGKATKGRIAYGNLDAALERRALEAFNASRDS